MATAGGQDPAPQNGFSAREQQSAAVLECSFTLHVESIGKMGLRSFCPTELRNQEMPETLVCLSA